MFLVDLAVVLMARFVGYNRTDAIAIIVTINVCYLLWRV